MNVDYFEVEDENFGIEKTKRKTNQTFDFMWSLASSYSSAPGKFVTGHYDLWGFPEPLMRRD